MQKKDEKLPGEESNGKRVSQKTLDSLELFNDALVRPMKFKGNIKLDNGYFGVIVKLPAANFEDDGEQWKRLLKKEKGFQVGDLVIYAFKLKIVLDGEMLHMVSYFIGKVSDTQING